ncbi:MAG TPA: hypothetical protein VN963_02080 [bacterium]|nr:hypothetical protein [bacterium]
MADPMNFINFIWFLIVGGSAGWIASAAGKDSGLLRDITGGILGAFLGASFAYLFNVNVYGF